MATTEVPYTFTVDGRPLGVLEHSNYYRVETSAKPIIDTKFIFHSTSNANQYLIEMLFTRVGNTMVSPRNDGSPMYLGMSTTDSGYLAPVDDVGAAKLWTLTASDKGGIMLSSTYGAQTDYLNADKYNVRLWPLGQFPSSTYVIMLGGGPAPAPAPMVPLPSTDEPYILGAHVLPNARNPNPVDAVLGTDAWRGRGAITIKTVGPQNATCKRQHFTFRQIEENYDNMASYVIEVSTDGEKRDDIGPSYSRESEFPVYLKLAWQVQDDGSEEAAMWNWRPDIGGVHEGGGMLFLVDDDRYSTVIHFEQHSGGFAIFTIPPGQSKVYLSTDGTEVTFNPPDSTGFTQVWNAIKPEWMRHARPPRGLRDDLYSYIPNNKVCQLQDMPGPDGKMFYYCNGFGSSYHMSVVLAGLYPKSGQPPFSWRTKTVAPIIVNTSPMLRYVPGKDTRGDDLVCMSGRVLGPSPSISHTSYVGTNDLVKSTSWSMNLGGSMPSQYGMLSGSLGVKSGHDITTHSDITTAEYNYKDYSGEITFEQRCFTDPRILNEINPGFMKAFNNLPVIRWTDYDWISTGSTVRPAGCPAANPDGTESECMVDYDNFLINWGTHILVRAVIGRRFILNESILGTSMDDLRTLEAKGCLELAPIGKDKKTAPAVPDESADDQTPGSDRQPTEEPGPPPADTKPPELGNGRMMRLRANPLKPPSPEIQAELCGGYDESTRNSATTKLSTQSRQVWGGDPALSARLIGTQIASPTGFNGIDADVVTEWLSSNNENDDYTDFEFMPVWELLRLIAQHSTALMASRGASFESLQAFSGDFRRRVGTLKMVYALQMRSCVPAGTPNVKQGIMYSNGETTGRKQMGMRVNSVDQGGVPTWGCWTEGTGCKTDGDCQGDDGSGGYGGCSCACRGDGCTERAANYVPYVSKDNGGKGTTSGSCHQAHSPRCAWDGGCSCNAAGAAAWVWTDSWADNKV